MLQIYSKQEKDRLDMPILRVFEPLGEPTLYIIPAY